jgi:hypothetical protein
MIYNNYDSYKLSNPEDDGYYTEQPTDDIKETVYFKYAGMGGKYWSYGMLTKEGNDIRVENCLNIPCINTDEIEATQTEFYETIYRIRVNYKKFEYIDRQEFMQQYNEARQLLDKIIGNETGN